jgi:hypothetical protein
VAGGYGGIALYDDHTTLNPHRSGEQLANARLIAAAPELLAACQRAVELLRIHGANVDENEPILAAIAKAAQP